MKNKMNEPLEVGDRITLIKLDDPFTIIPLGTKGTVTSVDHDPWSVNPLYRVEWDSGDTLSIIADEDVWIKDKKENIKESDTKKYLRLVPIMRSDRQGREIFNFLKKLRDTGIVNMVTASDFTWGGKDFLDRYLKIQELQGSYQQIEDEDEREELFDMAEKSKQVMISAAIMSLEKKGSEISVENVQRELRTLGNIALEYYILKFG